MTDFGPIGNLKALAALLARFGVAGLINTALGFFVIEALDVGLGVQPNIANACGYAIGMGVGFVLNHGFVFRCQDRSKAVVARYLATVLAAFLVNQLVLLTAHHVLGPAPLMRTVAQLAGMASYTTMSFVLCRQWVFRPRPVAAIAP
jgi:putative flippase GtrA